MFPVGLIGRYGVSSPIVKNGTLSGYYDGWIGGRKFAVDMAGQFVCERSSKLKFVAHKNEECSLNFLNFWKKKPQQILHCRLCGERKLFQRPTESSNAVQSWI